MDYQTQEQIKNGSVSARTMKRVLIETYGNKCWECGIESWKGKSIVFELEHKNGNSEDNSKENLSILCPNCHSQTLTYKNRNKGNGRHSRRERYKKGISF
jgi:Zn finger protein HypA/HybF involved in hydrogenase expression